LLYDIEAPAGYAAAAAAEGAVSDVTILRMKTLR
jgi:hypothetical protein